MRGENKKIMLSGEEAIFILCELEYVLISLRNIGRNYHQGSSGGGTDADYCKETTRFIDEKKVVHRLAKIRKVLSGKFDNSLGDDDMDDLERAIENIAVWEKPGD